MSLNVLAVLLDVLGVCIASAAIVSLRDVAGLVRSPGLRRSWWSLTIVVLCCMALLLASAVATIHRALDGFDLATTGIHVLGPIFVLGVARLSRRTALEMRRFEALGEAAFIDAWTGLPNRRRFDERLSDEVRRSQATGRPLSLLVLDVDHFRRVNDFHGHEVGDLVLRHVAASLAAGSRHVDTPCRIGGEEFVIIMPGYDADLAAPAADRLRRAVAGTRVPCDGGGEVHATVSLGLATLRHGESAHLLFRRADAALYGAKRGGRDRVGLAA